MAIFDRFRNRPKRSVLPDEVDEYYTSPQGERRGVAIVLGFITLIFTVMVAALIFFGSRAIYRNIAGDDQANDSSQTETANNTSEEKQEAKPKPIKKKPSATNPQSQGSSGSNSPSNSGSSSSAMPSTGDNNLPATGDPGL